MSEFLVKTKHFITKHIWFENEIDEIAGGGTTSFLFTDIHKKRETSVGLNVM